ncbi:MAG: helix-turn-helix domain-containing protein [Sporolactobacillus sp.]|uniref:winged helix-turn-helix transcriptional regulator n=1 Tax=Sporolactobacillus sp. STSJ-5 TaxID=2965076 RepID=UPI002104BA79|nr:helix-turn-helix domain-containing protein [Sporolactobacillus sp. STSJ-5]MCQ2009617.1 helix-turn-helix transcriptional regulator [Sporolactobacillus sp. STSJ-5]
MQRAVSVCPKFEKAFQILGKKWNGLIIEVLLSGETHFSSISAAIPELSDRMLSARLRELEEMGIIQRMVDTGYPVQVTYRLTEMGIESKPILEEVHNWANKWYGEHATEKK